MPVLSMTSYFGFPKMVVMLSSAREGACRSTQRTRYPTFGAVTGGASSQPPPRAWNTATWSLEIS